MAADSLTALLGPEIDDLDEETFVLFANDIPSQNLGFVDARAAVLELTVAGRDLTIHQSPSVLSSNRPGGTTGAVVWKITPLFAEWLAAPDNLLFRAGVLSSSSAVLELGCGIAGVVGLALAPRVAHYVLSDQPYVARLVEKNLDENRGVFAAAPQQQHRPHKAPHPHRGRRARPSPSPSPSSPASPPPRLRFAPLDWERDVVTPSLLLGPPSGGGATPPPSGPSPPSSFDAVLACDCIYNEALVPPFVQTCADACRLRAREDADADADAPPTRPCVCVVAQQLRDPAVLEAWLARFARDFRVWRLPDALAPEGLRPAAGFVVHVGVLREEGRGAR